MHVVAANVKEPLVEAEGGTVRQKRGDARGHLIGRLFPTVATCCAPGFRFARLDVHAGLLARAREEARAAIERSERLTGEENRGLRLLLYLFERDEAARLIEAG